jgi:hypothetical protein
MAVSCAGAGSNAEDAGHYMEIRTDSLPYGLSNVPVNHCMDRKFAAFETVALMVSKTHQ